MPFFLIAASFRCYSMFGAKKRLRVPPKSRQWCWTETAPHAKMQRSAVMIKKKTSNEYTLEFRQNAVRLTRLPGRTVASVAEELKIPGWKLHNWIKDSKDKLERSSDLDDLLKAHNEIKRLKEENEILKKAASYFAKHLQ
jgi:transposase